MEVLGNIKILSPDEIMARGLEFANNKLKKGNVSAFDVSDIKSNMERIKSEPMPYKLFRFNEILNYNLNGIGCEITEEQYYDRLEQLPPKSFTNDILSGYIVPECITENIFEHLFLYNDKYYCVVMRTNFKVV
jgi:hypothetical protein